MSECTASFDTLPIELLLAIFDSSDNKTLLNIGKTCQRLNSIAIPIFLTRLDIDLPTDEILIRPLHDSHADQLSGLTVDFSFVSIKRFVCILNHGQDNPRGVEEFGPRLSPIGGLERNVRRIQHLISRLQSVDAFCIVFYPMGAFWSLRTAMVEGFITAFFELMETVALKSCGSLQILHPHPITIKPPYKFQLTNPNKIENIVIKSLALVRPRDNELEGEGWKYQQIFKYDAPPSLSPSLITGNKLKVLELNSDFLLRPPFSVWTFTFLKHSQVTSLSLSLPTVISEGEFQYYIFPHILDALPELEELRFAAPRDEFIVSAIELMPRLSRLKKVTFGATQFGQFPPPSYTYMVPRVQLSHLDIFTGYIDQATYLLGNVDCPSLSTVNFIIDDTRGRPNYTMIGTKLAALRKRFREMGISPSTSMCVSNHGRGKQSLLPASDILEDSSRDIDFSIISQLTLELPISPNDDSSLIQQVEYIMEWLDIFSGLIGVTLTTRQPYHDAALLTEMVMSEYTNIKTFNIVDYPAVFHYHWSSAPNDLRRSIDRRSDIATFRNKSIEGCVCSEF